MYGVNASVPKTLVRHLVHYYADTCGDEELKAVLYDILDTPVSPELLPPEDGKIAQKTEDIVGPYELHDFYLYYILRLGFEPAKIYRAGQESLRRPVYGGDDPEMAEGILQKVLLPAVQALLPAGWPQGGNRGSLPPGRPADAQRCQRKAVAG